MRFLLLILLLGVFAWPFTTFIDKWLRTLNLSHFELVSFVFRLLVCAMLYWPIKQLVSA